MSISVAKGFFHLSRPLTRNRALLSNFACKSLSCFGEKNTRTLTRSLFFLCGNRYPTDPGNGIITTKVPLSNRCSCGCSLHTKGDEELVAFLKEEIENETKSRASPDLPKLEGFEVSFNGADVTLMKKLDNEIITITSNVNDSVESEEPDMNTNEAKEPEGSEMRAKPEFTVEIKKGKKTLCFHCAYSEEVEEESGGAYNAFQIEEVAMYEDEHDDSTYTVSGDIMDGYLYDLLMNYLEERGISNQFADKMIHFFTSYEHKLYINLLKNMKSFFEK